MAKRKGMPNVIVIDDGTSKKRYRATVFLIHTKNADGSPGLCKLIPDDQTIDLAGGEEFLIAYVSEHMLKK